jgi:hypothetical protein
MIVSLGNKDAMSSKKLQKNFRRIGSWLRYGKNGGLLQQILYASKGFQRPLEWVG